MSALIIAPVAVPLAAAALALALGPTRRGVQLTIATVASLALLGTAIALLLKVSADGIQVLEAGGWPAPLGIVLVVDLLSAIMLCLTGITGLAVVAYSVATIDTADEQSGYYPLLLVLLGGVSGAFITGDFFNLYVWFEVMLMSSFVLVALGGGRSQLEGALKYMVLNVISSVIFLSSLGLLYSVAGTVNFADLALFVRESPDRGLITAISMLFLVSFGIKAAVFPVFSWLPASYHTPPVAVSAIFAGLLTKVGVYAMIRVFTLIFVEDTGYTHEIILAVSGLTMVTGVLGAIAQNEFRKILSFHIVSQIGYMTMGLGLFTPLGIAGSIFYIIHHIIVKTNLFLVSGLVYQLRGTFELKKLGGLRAEVLLSLLFLGSALSLAGVPPLSGFFAKLTLIRAGIDEGEWLIVGIALAAGLLTLFSMNKIWSEVFAKDPPTEPVTPARRPSLLAVAPSLGLVLITVSVGVGAGEVLDLSLRASEQLLDPSAYITAVLGPEVQP